mmetsp:Transcript_47772/g.89407  ORF Transcript_47772/g.89407 Transcript_47772/m.89407 type:complete len:410 (-) Transcript_47772:236-1465(-)
MPVRASAGEKLNKAAQLRKKCASLEVEARAQKIFALIKQTPEYCGACEAALAECGVNLEAAFLEDEKCSKKAASKKNAPTDELALPRTTTTLGGFAQEILFHLVVNLQEPVITVHSLNALKPSPKKGIPKAAVQEILEFATECGPGTWVGTTGPLKILGNLSKVLVELNKLHGHRLRSLPLPPAWESHGVYQVTAQGNSLYITHRFMSEKATRPLPEEQLALVKDVAQLTIEANYSSKNAVLSETGGVLAFPLKKLFGDSIADDPFEDVKGFILQLPEDGSGAGTKQAMITAPSASRPAASPERAPVKMPFVVRRLSSQTNTLTSKAPPGSPTSQSIKRRRVSTASESSQNGGRSCNKEVAAEDGEAGRALTASPKPSDQDTDVEESAEQSPKKEAKTELELELPDAGA